MLLMKSGKGRLEHCELWGNADCGVWVQQEGDPSLAACTIRDHAAGRACGVYVLTCASGKATIGADCVFTRNEKGDVVRQVFAADAPPEMAALCGIPQALRPALHLHALTYVQAGAAGHTCDVCSAGLTEKSGAFQCVACDFDACIACFY